MNEKNVERWEALAISDDLLQFSKAIPEVISVIAGKTAKGAQLIFVCSSAQEMIEHLTTLASGLNPEQHLVVVRKQAVCHICHIDNDKPCDHFDRLATLNQSYVVDKEKIKRS